MEKYANERRTQVLYVGIDVHKRTYHMTGKFSDGREVFNFGMAADKDALVKYLSRWGLDRVEVVYEAGYFGYSLHDYLVECGARCIVTPPSLIPGEYGNKVKTDKRDSRKLSTYLSKGLLKRVYVLSETERNHRQVIRTRRQLINDRKRKQNQIKSFMAQYGLELPKEQGAWTKRFVWHLKRIRFNDRWLGKCFKQLLDAYEFTDNQVAEQTALLKELAKTDMYSERVKILTSIPGIGIISAMELLLELQEVERFRTAGQLAAYVGLTPSQFSSGDNVRMGHITRVGKPQLRAILIEAAWILIRKDTKARKTYERIRARAGGKRAIVAVARRLLIQSRRMIINNSQFTRCA